MSHCSQHPGWSPNGEPVVTCESVGHVVANDPTADGVEIRVGLRCFTNNLELCTVVGLAEDGWHSVHVDGTREGATDRFNGERLVTVHPFTKAKAV